MTTTTHLDEGRLQALLGQAIGDIGALVQGPLVRIGEELGLFRALADDGPLTTTELAAGTGTAERYVREWVRAMAAGGYVEYHPDRDRYGMNAEQVAVLVDEESPVHLLGGFESAMASHQQAARLAAVFRTGDGIGWHEHAPGVACGTGRFYGSSYRANLVDGWLPSLDGMVERLRSGVLVADVACGVGVSTLLMARAFPASTFLGFDYHEDSVEEARRNARAAGLEDRVRFEVARADDFPGRGYSLVSVFDAFHDLGDPGSAARHARDVLTADGTLMLVEPRASDRVEENLHPLGRLFYAASTLLCTPNALSQGGRVALGAQAGEAALREVVTGAGFSRFRRATETPFNLVLEARP